MSYYSTKKVAKLLGINTSRLARAVWDERFTPPQKGPGGNFLWTNADIERASWSLRKQGIDDVLGRIKKQESSECLVASTGRTAC